MLFYASLCFYFFNYPCRLCCNVFSPSYSVCIFFSSFGWLPSSYFMFCFVFFNLSFPTWLVLVLLPDIISCLLNDCLPYFYCLHLWFFAFSCIFSTTCVLSLKNFCVHHPLFPFDFVRVCCATRWSSTRTDVNVQLFFWNSFFKCKSFVCFFVCLFFDCSFCFLSWSCIWVIPSEPWQKLFWRAHMWHMLRSSLRDFFQGIESKSSFSLC